MNRLLLEQLYSHRKSNDECLLQLKSTTIFGSEASARTHDRELTLRLEMVDRINDIIDGYWLAHNKGDER